MLPFQSQNVNVMLLSERIRRRGKLSARPTQSVPPADSGLAGRVHSWHSTPSTVLTPPRLRRPPTLAAAPKSSTISVGSTRYGFGAGSGNLRHWPLADM